MGAAESAGPPHVVIVGGGFGGLWAARGLARAAVAVTLVDRHNYHLFQPLLYQVATAGLATPDITAPIRRIVRKQRNATVLLGTVAAIDVEGRRVVLTDGAIPFDVLVLAAGSVPAYFGHDEWARHAPGLKDCDDALAIRRRILLAFEAAERERSPERQAPWLTFVVIGGGPTGVELAGALADIARTTLTRDFRNIEPEHARIVLLEAGERILPGFDPELSRAARHALGDLGVEVKTGSRVTGVDERGVDIGETRYEARTVLWAAGVRAQPLTASLGVPLDGTGRVLVEPDLSVPGQPGLFVIGDAAAIADGEGWVPGVAPAAMQAGRHVARNIELFLQDRPTLPFRYRDRGMLATVGRSAAVGNLGPIKLTGLAGWLVWSLVHVAQLIGFRSRVLVLFEWAWLYATRQRGARVMLDAKD